VRARWGILGRRVTQQKECIGFRAAASGVGGIGGVGVGVAPFLLALAPPRFSPAQFFSTMHRLLSNVTHCG
jgi:hypothetical protein